MYQYLLVINSNNILPDIVRYPKGERISIKKEPEFILTQMKEIFKKIMFNGKVHEP